MVNGDVMCAAVRCEVLMQHHVRQPDDVMRQSSLIDRVVNERNLMRMFHRNVRD